MILIFDLAVLDVKKRTYNTKNRAALEEYIAASPGGHMTAEEISRAMKDAGTPMGLATIYRLLDRMVEQGRVARIAPSSGTTSACYKYLGGCPDDRREHHHMLCGECGRIIHVECGEIDALAGHLMDKHNFEMDVTRLVLHGTCGECRDDDNKLAPEEK